MIKSEKNFWSGLMFIVIGLGFAIGAREYSFGDAARPGPGYFPFGLGVMLAVLGVLVVLGAVTGRHRPEDEIGAWPLKPMALVLAGVLLFGFLIPIGGLVAALPALVIVGNLASGKINWVETLITAAVLTLGAWLIFSKGLGLTIPFLPPALG